jgi:hypothetical protein
MLDENQLEQNRRRRDTGSGLSFELFNKEILEFIFNSIVRKKLLASYSGQDVYSEHARMITWDEEYGIALKEDTDEIVFLGASSVDKVLIRNILTEDGGFSAISTLSQDSGGLGEAEGRLAFETVTAVLDLVIAKIGPLIKICTANGYPASDKDVFIDDHIFFESNASDNTRNKVPKKRLVAYYTKDTKQGKIVVESYYTGREKTRKAGSHVGMIDKRTLHSFTEEQKGVFSLAARYMNAWKNG